MKVKTNPTTGNFMVNKNSYVMQRVYHADPSGEHSQYPQMIIKRQREGGEWIALGVLRYHQEGEKMKYIGELDNTTNSADSKVYTIEIVYNKEADEIELSENFDNNCTEFMSSLKR